LAFWIQSLRTSIVYRVLAWDAPGKNGCPGCYINKKSAVLQKDMEQGIGNSEQGRARRGKA